MEVDTGGLIMIAEAGAEVEAGATGFLSLIRLGQINNTSSSSR